MILPRSPSTRPAYQVLGQARLAGGTYHSLGHRDGRQAQGRPALIFILHPSFFIFLAPTSELILLTSINLRQVQRFKVWDLGLVEIITSLLHYIPSFSFFILRSSYFLPHTSYLILPTSYLLPHTSYLIPPTSYLLPHTSYFKYLLANFRALQDIPVNIRH
jgi:hypothetical protein